MRKDDGLLDGAGGTGREIDRRTIAKGVAWTVPVVVVATAAPAAAGSGDLHLAAAATLGNPDGNNHEIHFTAYSHGVAGTVQITVPGGKDVWSTESGSVAVAANGQGRITLMKKKNKSGSTESVTYSYTPVGKSTVSGLTQSVTIPATPK
jgi:hypothetical protein